jgi:energy-converting hydrogenase Eha subunit H
MPPERPADGNCQSPEVDSSLLEPRQEDEAVNDYLDRVRRAKAEICGACVASVLCTQDALEYESPVAARTVTKVALGMRGGMSDEERRKLTSAIRSA